MEYVRGALDSGLTSDVAILTALAHCGWLATNHLHALCLPGAVVATVRTTLRYLAEARWIVPIRWRIGVPDGGHAWAITPQGVALLTRYLPVERPQVINDLGRPRSAVEQAEWVVQRLVRDLVVRLVHEARQAAVLAALTPRFAPWPPVWGGAEAADSVLQIAWHPPRQQAAQWVPWARLDRDAEFMRYVLLVVRDADPLPVRQLLTFPMTATTVPVLIVHDAAERHHVQQQLQRLEPHGRPRQVRISDRWTLMAGVSGRWWWDGTGQRCTLAEEGS